MSSDISIKVERHHGHKAYIEVGNYTSNANKMLYGAIRVTMGWFDEKSCKDAAPFLEHAVKLMESDPEKFIQLQPENGWGDYQSYLSFLKKWETLVKEHPNGVIINFY